MNWSENKGVRSLCARDFSRNGVLLLVAEGDVAAGGDIVKNEVKKFLSAFAGEE